MTSTDKAVYLLHGIRDFGRWTTDFKAVFREKSIKAGSKHLGWIGIDQFLFPDSTYLEKEDEVLADLKSYKDSEITIIAHSFGDGLLVSFYCAVQK